MRSAKDIWEAALGEIEMEVSRPNFETWLKDTRGISYENESFTIAAPNTFIAEWLENRLRSLIKKTLATIIGRKVNVQFVVQCATETIAPAAAGLQTDGGTSVRITPIGRHGRTTARYTFNNFVTGKCNRLAYAASLEVSENPGHIYNPLFIYGDTGVGKTHLLQAIRHMAKAAGYHVLYVSTEKLTNDFVAAIRNGESEAFRSKYSGVDFLLVDDFHFLSGKNQTQECFFHIFNDCYDSDCQIVLTCDCPPKAIASINKKLRSRLEWGLVVGIEGPDLETRLSILSVKSQQVKVDIPDETMQFISSCFPNNIRELEGGFNRVITYAKLSGEQVDMNIARQALADLVQRDEESDASPSPDHILEAVAGYYNLETEVLKSKKRDRSTALARQVAMYLLREQNNMRLNEIGRILGDRDHSTVLHGCDKISTELKSNAQLKKAIDILSNDILRKK